MSKLLGMIMLIGICCVIFFLEIIFIDNGAVSYLCSMLIIQFGKYYSHFIDEKAEILTIHYKTTKEGAEFEPRTDCKTLAQRMLYSVQIGNNFCP